MPPPTPKRSNRPPVKREPNPPHSCVTPLLSKSASSSGFSIYCGSISLMKRDGALDSCLPLRMRVPAKDRRTAFLARVTAT